MISLLQKVANAPMHNGIVIFISIHSVSCTLSHFFYHPMYVHMYVQHHSISRRYRIFEANVTIITLELDPVTIPHRRVDV